MICAEGSIVRDEDGGGGTSSQRMERREFRNIRNERGARPRGGARAPARQRTKD